MLPDKGAFYGPTDPQIRRHDEKITEIMTIDSLSAPSGKEVLPIAMADGSRLTMTVYPVKGKVCPVCIILPAMGVPASWYEPLAGTLVRQGLHAVAADLRGHAGSTLRASRSVDFGFHEMVTCDLPGLVAATARRLPGCPVYLLGHSLGGQLGTLYASLYPESVRGLILVATCSVYYRGWPFPKSLGLLLATQLARGIADVTGHFPGRTLGFGGREARTVMRDWAHNARTGRYEPANSPVNLESALSRMQTPVLAISLEGDQFAPPRAVRYLCDKLISTRVRHLHLDGWEMPDAGRHHFRWVRHAGPIVRHIRRWMAGTD